jgi:hypothetical protein
MKVRELMEHVNNLWKMAERARTEIRQRNREIAQRRRETRNMIARHEKQITALERSSGVQLRPTSEERGRMRRDQMRERMRRNARLNRRRRERRISNEEDSLGW